jgi:hypothetical protein
MPRRRPDGHRPRHRPRETDWGTPEGLFKEARSASATARCGWWRLVVWLWKDPGSRGIRVAMVINMFVAATAGT